MQMIVWRIAWFILKVREGMDAGFIRDSEILLRILRVWKLRGLMLREVFHLLNSKKVTKVILN